MTRFNSLAPRIVRFALLAAGLPLAVAAGDQPGSTKVAAADRAALARIERGQYLVTTSACHDCHTPWIETASGAEPDMSRMLSGHPASEAIVEPPAALPAGPWVAAISATNTAWSGPWGTSFTANLTPDEETGIGKWSFEEFRDTIRTGRHLGRGRAILPPMPIPMYRHFNDEDLEAIYSFLRSIPPISNKVPEPLIPGEPLGD